MKKRNTNIKEKKNFSSFSVNKIINYKCKKVQNNNIDFNSNAINNINQNNINNLGINKQGNFSNSNIISSNSNENTIPDFIIELLILMYKLSKDIKYKLASKDKNSEDFYIINADFLSQIKMIYNYKGISEEVQEFNYISENEFNNKIPDLINSIRQKEIVKDIVPLDDMKIVPVIDKLFKEGHFVNFGLVNIRMYGLIEKIKNFFGLEGKLNPIKQTFYFTPQLYYVGKDYIKIGVLNDEDVFDMHYYLKVDLYKTNFISMVI